VALLQRLEVAWRAAWMRAIAARLPGPSTTQLRSLQGRRVRILFLRYERIGDMVMATSLIRAIATSHSGIELDVVAAPNTVPVLRHNPYVRDIFTLDKRSGESFRELLRNVKQRNYEIVVDGRINNPPIFTSTPLIMLATRAPFRIGVSGGRGNRIYNVRVHSFDRNDMRTHYIDASAHLATPFDVDIQLFDWRPQLFLDDDEVAWGEQHWNVPSGARLLVNLSASEKKRRWPDERFINVIRRAQQIRADLTVRVIALPSEWDSALAVAEKVGGVAVRTPSLRDAFSIVKSADFVFTPDTSISHVASAFSKPAVVLLKKEHAQYGPYRTAGTIVYWKGETMADLDERPVTDAVTRLVRT
jgi:ADP-heptose:LPS heptosyltransferase